MDFHGNNNLLKQQQQTTKEQQWQHENSTNNDTNNSSNETVRWNKYPRCFAPFRNCSSSSATLQAFLNLSQCRKLIIISRYLGVTVVSLLNLQASLESVGGDWTSIFLLKSSICDFLSTIVTSNWCQLLCLSLLRFSSDNWVSDQSSVGNSASNPLESCSIRLG